MKHIHLVDLLIALLLIASCSKPEDNDPNPAPPPPPPTKAQLLLGKWKMESIVHMEVNGPGRFVVTGSPADYFDFAKDSLYTNVRGTQQNAKYVLHANDSLSLYYPPLNTIKEEHLLVTILTESEMQIRGTAQGGAIGVVSLKR